MATYSRAAKWGRSTKRPDAHVVHSASSTTTTNSHSQPLLVWMVLTCAALPQFSSLRGILAFPSSATTRRSSVALALREYASTATAALAPAATKRSIRAMSLCAKIVPSSEAVRTDTDPSAPPRPRMRPPQASGVKSGPHTDSTTRQTSSGTRWDCPSSVTLRAQSANGPMRQKR